MAMLHLFSHAAKERGFSLEVATVDHGLRDEAKAEAAFVAKTSKTLGVGHRTLTWEGWDGSGNLQAKARDARYRILADWGRSIGLDVICLGHTCDDLAETFLMRLRRHSGIDGLAAMASRFNRHDQEFARPFLCLSRDELRGFLRRHGLKWCEDPSNDDKRFERVRVRQLLARLEQEGIGRQSFADLALEFRMAKSALRLNLRNVAERMISEEDGDFVLDRAEWAALNEDQQRRLLGLLLQWIAGSEYSPRGRALSEMVSGKEAMTLNGCLVTWNEGRHIRISREFNVVKDLRCSTTELWDRRWRLEGPHDERLHVGALGEDGIRECPDWRSAGLPRSSLLTTPALWSGDELIAAPVARLPNGWCAELTQSKKQFLQHLITR